MSLQTDIIFFDALSADTELMQSIGSRLYNTSIPVPDVELLNEPLPYVIITFDGLNNDDQTKDDVYEGFTDKVQIGIEVMASTREELGSLTTAIRRIIHDDFNWVWRYEELRAAGEPVKTSDGFKLRVMRDFDEMARQIPSSYVFSAGQVGYDPDKPAYWQQLHYQCDIENTILYEQEN